MVLNWFVMGVGGGTEGPFSTDVLVKWIEEKKLGASSHVCPEGASSWVSLGDVDVFAAALQGTQTAVLESGSVLPVGSPPRGVAPVMRVETPLAPVVGPTPSSAQKAPGATRATRGKRIAAIGAVVLGMLLLAGGALLALGGGKGRDARVRQALVHVVAGPHGGTGFFVAGPDAFAYVVTAYHVVESGDPVHVERMVEVSDKKSYVEAYPSIEIVAVDPDADLAVLRLREVQAKNFARLPLAKAPVKDENVVAYGFPDSNLGKLSTAVNAQGKISSTTKFDVMDRVAHRKLRTNAIEGILISAQIEPGYSGGPTVNERDEVVGVNVLKDLEHTLNGAVSVEVLAKLVEKLKPASDPIVPAPEEVASLLKRTESDYLKKTVSDRMEVRETDFVASDDLPTVRKLAGEVSEMGHDMSKDENKLNGPARLGVVFASLSGKPLETFQADDVKKALAPCPKEALSLFGSAARGSKAAHADPAVDCERYASRALAWDLTASVVQWEGVEHDFTVSNVERVNDESLTFKATVSAKGAAHSYPVWISSGQGRLRLKLFDENGKPYWIERHGSADVAAFRGRWTYTTHRQRVSNKPPLDGTVTETIDVDVDAQGVAQVKHRFIRTVFAEPGRTWRCNVRETAEVGLEQNFSGHLDNGVVWLTPASMAHEDPVVTPAGADSARCSDDMRIVLGGAYTADRIVLLRFVNGRLVMRRTDGGSFPEEVDFNKE